MTNIKETIYKMMMTSTGTHMMDSGFGERGRAWQRNQLDYPTIGDIEKSPQVSFEQPSEEGLDSSDISFRVSVYHHLVNSLELDELCEAFNALPCDDWDSEEAYGISQSQAKWLKKRGLKIGDGWNSYNGDSNLSQVLQGENVYLDGDSMEFPTYILLQLHQGADVRGGYTDAKLFKVDTNMGYFDTNPIVYGIIDDIQVDTAHDNNTLTNESREVVPVTINSKIELYLN